MAQAFKPSTWEAEASGSLSLRSAWSTRASFRKGSKTTEKLGLEKRVQGQFGGAGALL